MFSVRTAPEKFKNVTIACHFGFVFDENLGREITWSSLRHHHRFQKASFSKCFPSTRKRKADIFKFPPGWRAFSKRCVFDTDLVWTVGLTGERKLCFQIPPTQRGRCLRFYCTLFFLKCVSNLLQISCRISHMPWNTSHWILYLSAEKEKKKSNILTIASILYENIFLDICPQTSFPRA